MKNEELLDELQLVFLQVFRKMAQQWGKHVEKGLSGSQAFILEQLEKNGKLRATDLAEGLGITSGAVTGLCDKLIQCGYAERSRTEEDRRVVFMEITDDGRDILESVKERRKEITEMFYSRLSDEDLRHLIRIYNQVMINIETRE